MDAGLDRQQFDFRLDGSMAGAILNGPSPVPGEGDFRLSEPPPGAPMTPGPERPEEFSPGLPPDLRQMADQMAAMAEGVTAAAAPAR